VRAWFLLAALAASPQPEVVRVGMDTRSRPWAFVPGLDYAGEDFSLPPRITPAQLDQLVGLDVDILAALSRRLGVRVQIVPAVWEEIEKGLVDGRYDVIMNAWVPSSKTPPSVAASSAYYDWGLLVVVNAEDTRIASFADLAGKVVGHFGDPSVDRSAGSLQAGRLVPFEDSDALFEALAARKLDAVVEDSSYARWRAAHDREVRIVGQPLNRLGYHLGVRREDAPLLGRIEAAIKDLRASGQLERIRRRWESADSPGLDPP
jgi:polar amino acid transport system substrate-binding protein